MEIRKTILSAALAISTLTLSSASMADHAWANYHWERSANPFNIDLGDNVDSSWDGHLLMASGDWTVSTVLDTTVIAGSTKPRQCRVKTGSVQVCNDTYGNNGWLGIASISISGDHITGGYVKVNDTYFNTAAYDTPAWRQLVMCQEVGHAFGLGHQDEAFTNANLDSCMDYTNDPESNQYPNAHDYEQLELIYAHLDSSGGGGSDDGGGGCNPRSPKCNGASAADILSVIEMNGPAQWGRLVSEHGPQEVYELDLGGGRKVVTHVTWTLERARDHGH